WFGEQAGEEGRETSSRKEDSQEESGQEAEDGARREEDGEKNQAKGSTEEGGQAQGGEGKAPEEKESPAVAFSPHWIVPDGLPIAAGAMPLGRLRDRSGLRSREIHASHAALSIDVAATPSRRRRCSFTASPPAKPVSAPLDPITRWHGVTIEIGLRPF